MLPDEVRRAWADRCGLPWDENDDRVREPEKSRPKLRWTDEVFAAADRGSDK